MKKATTVEFTQDDLNALAASCTAGSVKVRCGRGAGAKVTASISIDEEGFNAMLAQALGVDVLDLGGMEVSNIKDGIRVTF